jgi:hypothetical protein
MCTEVRRYVKGTRMSRMDRQVCFFLVEYVRMFGWLNKFPLFQFSFSSVAYSQVICPSVRRSQAKKKERKKKNVTDKHRHTDPIGVILNVTDGTIQTCRTINITFSQYAMRNAMQCNTMQCNAIQCNAMQCNAMQCVRKSVRRTEWSQSVIFFFFLFFFLSRYERTVGMYGTRMSRTDRRISFFLSSMCTNVTDGQTSFSYFSLVSVQSHTVSKSVRPSHGGPDQKRKKNTQTNTNTDPIGGNTFN